LRLRSLLLGRLEPEAAGASRGRFVAVPCRPPRERWVVLALRLGDRGVCRELRSAGASDPSRPRRTRVARLLKTHKQIDVEEEAIAVVAVR
jgi:hypothetical protein